MVHAYIGDGKGKTTASIGLAVRCAGSGQKVEIIQFLKDGTSNENKILEALEIRMTFCQNTKKFFWNMSDDEKKRLASDSQDGIKYAEKALQSGCWMVVLDEILDALENNLISEEELSNFLNKYGKEKEIVLTGRKLPAKIGFICDYVSEIKKLKHPFDNGTKARKGIEY